MSLFFPGARSACVDSRRDFSLCLDMHDIALSVRHERTPEMAVIVSKTGDIVNYS